jgi:phage I-like protein
VFRYDPKTGDVLAVEMGALTNTPAIDGMEELSLRAAACFGATPEEDNVNLLQLLIAALGLSADATEPEAIAALNQRLSSNDLTALRTTLGVDATADVGTMVAACTALRETATPDPAKYVPITGLTELQGQVAALSQKLAQRDEKDADDLVDAALEDGRLVKGLEAWARDLGKKDVAALSSYLTAAKPLTQLLASQTNGAPPVVDDKTGLTKDELAVCSNMGITAEEFIAAKPAA